MRTIVFQSYNTINIPTWIQKCLTSVEDWSRKRGYTYRILGDEFFEPVPVEFRQRCGTDILPVTDVARVLWIRRLLDEGFERVVWLDADFMIFPGQGFEIDSVNDYALCREIWVEARRNHPPTVYSNVNNCALVVTAGSDFVERYLSTVLEKTNVGALDAGTKVFNDWQKMGKLPLLTSVATVNHALIHDLVRGQSSFIRLHAAVLGEPCRAAHFVHSYSRPGKDRVWIPENNFTMAVERVLEGGAAILNPPPIRRS